jgi:hypothetical protein
MKKKIPTPTPRTDAMASTMFPDGSKWGQQEDCRQLERELAAVEGGSDDRPILRHNGVGEADMYSGNEYAQLMLPQSIPTAKVTDIHFLCIGAVLEPGQWVDWEVAFTYQGEACLGFLQACPAHPYLMHHHQIKNCCYG